MRGGTVVCAAILSWHYKERWWKASLTFEFKLTWLGVNCSDTVDVNTCTIHVS